MRREEEYGFRVVSDQPLQGNDHRIAVEVSGERQVGEFHLDQRQRGKPLSRIAHVIQGEMDAADLDPLDSKRRPNPGERAPAGIAGEIRWRLSRARLAKVLDEVPQ